MFSLIPQIQSHPSALLSNVSTGSIPGEQTTGKRQRRQGEQRSRGEQAASESRAEGLVKFRARVLEVSPRVLPGGFEVLKGVWDAVNTCLLNNKHSSAIPAGCWFAK